MAAKGGWHAGREKQVNWGIGKRIFSSSVHEEVQSTHLSLIKQATLVSMCNMTYVNQVASHPPIFVPTFASDYPTYMNIL